MRTLSTLAEIDSKLQECRLAATISDDALRAAFAGFQGSFALDHPADPFSEEYRLFQMSLYERFAGRVYSTENEFTPFDVKASVRRPFPYSTENAATAGQHLGAVAFLLRCLRLRPGARVLEFGPGWGNTTIALAQLGFEVTAVDIDPNFCEFLRLRARQTGVKIDVVNSDFFWAEQVTRPFDAVIFFEFFHHCADHLRLMRSLHRALCHDGLVYFGAEPILADYPIPWGLRMDGEALWAIGTQGWLELGFRESYFQAALNRTGWIGRSSRSVDLPWITVWEASALSERSLVFGATDSRIGSINGRKSGNRILVAAEFDGYSLYGPHIPLAAGKYCGSIYLVPQSDIKGEFTIDVCAARGVTVLAAASLDIEVAKKTGVWSIDFELSEQFDEVEIRLFSMAGAIASIQKVVIERRLAP